MKRNRNSSEHRQAFSYGRQTDMTRCRMTLSIECNRIHMSNASESICRCRKPEIDWLSHLFLFRLKTSKGFSRDPIKGKKRFNLSRQLFLGGSLLSLNPLLRRGTRIVWRFQAILSATLESNSPSHHSVWHECPRR